MAFAVRIRVEASGNALATAQAALRRPRPYMRGIGVHTINRAAQRLTTVLSQDTRALRSGRLQQSLTILAIGDNFVDPGTNVKYAAQVNFGGPIEPKPPNKALAIPLTDQLRRYELSPRDLPPDMAARIVFLPRRRGGNSNVVGYLLLKGRAKAFLDKAGTKLKKGHGSETLLYVLVKRVVQKPRPCMFLDDADVAHITGVLARRWLEGGL